MYERPYTAAQMRAAGYPDALVRKLMADPVHAWRARTGIELIHKEPDLEEAIRVWVNWNRMSAADKARSDRKSKKLFGVDNKTHYEQLRPAYATKKAALVTAVPLISAIIRSIRADPGSPDRTINLPEVLREMVHLDKAVDQSKTASAADDIIAQARTHYPAVGSHGWNHIEDVMANATRMRRRRLLLKELAAIAYHDSSLTAGPRETHAEDSAAIAGRELRAYFRRRQLQDIVNAIAHHRASYEGPRKSRLEDLVAAADRNVPDVEKDIRRSYAYGLEHGMTQDEAVQNTLHHMPDKYGRKGYAYRNVPKIYMDTYGDAVRKAQDAFDALTEDDVRRIAGIARKAG